MSSKFEKLPRKFCERASSPLLYHHYFLMLHILFNALLFKFYTLYTPIFAMLYVCVERKREILIFHLVSLWKFIHYATVVVNNTKAVWRKWGKEKENSPCDDEEMLWINFLCGVCFSHCETWCLVRFPPPVAKVLQCFLIISCSRRAHSTCSLSKWIWRRYDWYFTCFWYSREI